MGGDDRKARSSSSARVAAHLASQLPGTCAVAAGAHGPGLLAGSRREKAPGLGAVGAVDAVLGRLLLLAVAAARGFGVAPEGGAGGLDDVLGGLEGISQRLGCGIAVISRRDPRVAVLEELADVAVEPEALELGAGHVARAGNCAAA
ncbi:hypothetical protein CTA1_6430 [Colletotrichum tanaceti]|uniref:Uncharacterized protein n=1 Tax=Colletotrichum tanaceti TaxID=1306861 RepID=A0A4U6X038_9PEZI|nr:hypothetical protein CTA1_6430 [Colletotrichum tanaceti]